MPRMTVNALHKLLGKLINQGHARKPVCIDKTTFTHNLEQDGCLILEVCGVDILPIIKMDDDGGSKVDSKGRECYQQTCVLVGSSGATVDGRVLKERFG